MPWREASPMDQRTQFIADHLRDVLSITELCALYGIFRKTGYKWIDRYRRHGPPGKPTSPILAPNDVWSADYKGQFRTGDGRYCYPLTVADGFSRYLLGCQALTSTAGDEAKPIFTRLFHEYGLPRRIRSDNGVPFATTTLAD